MIEFILVALTIVVVVVTLAARRVSGRWFSWVTVLLWIVWGATVVFNAVR